MPASTGVRRDESLARSQRQWQEWDDYYDCELYNPVYDWTKQMCFDYVRQHKEQINPLYSLGFTRVGCAPCVNSGKDDILNWATRFPEMIDKVRAWEQHVGRTFFAPCVPGMAINWIDDVVAWAKTDHGGRQNNLFRILPPPACRIEVRPVRMRYLSVCSGIEAVSVAWQPLGWQPAMFAEIDPFCCWLLRSRYRASRPCLHAESA